MPTDHREFALAAAPLAAAVANYCDHVEHNETSSTAWILEAAEGLVDLALQHAQGRDINLFRLYGERLRAIEDANVLTRPNAFDGQAAVATATTWRDLQLAQVAHDRFYHPDVAGMARIDQLRHYALHLTKIVGAFARGDSDDELLARRLPDTLLFAIKLHTVIGVRMADTQLPRVVESRG